MKDIKTANKIIIIGAAGRGKTTFANSLSEKLGYKVYSTDDFLWKTKFTEMYPREEGIRRIKDRVYNSKDEWIVEGTTDRLISPGFEEADVIVHLKFKNIFSQYISLIKRSRKRKNENLRSLIVFLIWVTKVRYSKEEKYIERKKIQDSYLDKTLVLESYEDIDELIDGLK